MDVCVGEDALERLAAFWTSALASPALVVMDANTQQAAGSRVVEALRSAGVDVEQLVFTQRTGLRPTPAAAERVREKLSDGRLPLAVGSGVITDVVRHAANVGGRDFVSVPTAASMDGYASSVAALERDGVKVTYPARTPRAIFAEPSVLAAAPDDLTRAGLGDLLGKATAHVDWLTAHLLYGEPYRAEVAASVQQSVAFAARHVQAVLRGDVKATEGLFAGLVRSGQAMATVGSSRPASGCEHHASHFWDLLAARGLRGYALHGLQVGYATRFAMKLQRRAIDLESVRPPVPVADPLGPQARLWLGAPTPDIRAAVREKRRFVSDLAHWPADSAAWDAIRDRVLAAADLFPLVDAALAEAGIPAEPGFLDIDEPALRAAFRHATRLRARYTALDLLEGQALLDAAIDALL